MRTILSLTARLHDQATHRRLRQDEEGLTMLAYALGAAIIVVPLAAAIITFATGSVSDAESVVESAINAP